jgi:hypothetical protein
LPNEIAARGHGGRSALKSKLTSRPVGAMRAT